MLAAHPHVAPVWRPCRRVHEIDLIATQELFHGSLFFFNLKNSELRSFLTRRGTRPRIASSPRSVRATSPSSTPCSTTGRASRGAASQRWYASEAVQFHPNCGQFDHVWLRTYDAPPCCVRVVSLTKSSKIATRKIIPLLCLGQDRPRGRRVSFKGDSRNKIHRQLVLDFMPIQVWLSTESGALRYAPRAV